MIDPYVLVGENSYISLDFADEIAGSRLFSSVWGQSSDADLSRALITATARLDCLRWRGVPVSPTQPLAWPRTNHGGDTDTPAAILIATVELAIHLLKAAEPESPPVMQRMLGDSMIMYFAAVPDELPKHVRRLIEPYLLVSSANVAEVQF